MTTEIDHEALYLRAVEQIATSHGLRQAHRRGKGLLMRRIRTVRAQETLAAAAWASAKAALTQTQYPPEGHAYFMAQAAPFDVWWSFSFPSFRSTSGYMEGEIYLSPDHVREAVEEFENCV